jgi:isoquinoline 1-oxidoreductase alpha subunit
MAYTLRINGTPHQVDVDPDTPLLWAIRDVVGLTGTKFGCGMAMCGACTVHADGVAIRSCVTPVEAVANQAITTIEGVHQTPTGRAVQKAWLDLDVVQCGYCQSGQIMSACALLASTPRPSETEVADAMAGNLCRCGTYARIKLAVLEAAKSLPAKQGA